CPGDGAPGRPGRAPRGPALGRTAAAGGPGPRGGARAGGVAAGRAHVRPRPQAARGDAGGGEVAPPPPGHDLRVRDPRPGGGPRPQRSRGRHERRRDRADGLARRALRRPAHALRGRVPGRPQHPARGGPVRRRRGRRRAHRKRAGPAVERLRLRDGGARVGRRASGAPAPGRLRREPRGGGARGPALPRRPQRVARACGGRRPQRVRDGDVERTEDGRRGDGDVRRRGAAAPRARPAGDGVMSARTRQALFLLAPAVFLLVVLVGGSQVLMLAASLGRRSAYGGVIPGWSLANYLRALEPLYIRVLVRSLVLAAGTTIVCLVVGYPVAYWLARRAPPTARRALLVLVILPFWT